MTARKAGKVTPKCETKYRERNWPAYEASLIRRGDVTIWFDQESFDCWNTPPSGRPGGQQRRPTNPPVSA